MSNSTSPQQRPVQHNPYSITPMQQPADTRGDMPAPPPMDGTPKTSGTPQQGRGGDEGGNASSGSLHARPPSAGGAFSKGPGQSPHLSFMPSLYAATPQQGPSQGRVSPGPSLGPSERESQQQQGGQQQQQPQQGPTRFTAFSAAFGSSNNNNASGASERTGGSTFGSGGGGAASWGPSAYASAMAGGGTGGGFHGNDFPSYAAPHSGTNHHGSGGGYGGGYGGSGGGGGGYGGYGGGSGGGGGGYGSGSGGGGGGYGGGGGGSTFGGTFRASASSGGSGAHGGGSHGGGGGGGGSGGNGTDFTSTFGPPREFTPYAPPAHTAGAGGAGSGSGSNNGGVPPQGGMTRGGRGGRDGAVPRGMGSGRIAHSFLNGKLRYIALPSDLFVQLPPQRLQTQMGEIDRPIQMYSGRGRDMQTVCPTADLFVAQLPFNMELSALQLIFDAVASMSCDIMHAAPHYKRGRSYDGCAFVKVSQAVAAILVETFHKAALFDQEGVWIADTPDQRDALAQYCAFMQQKSPQERRQILQKPIPFSAMTVEFANRSYSF